MARVTSIYYHSTKKLVGYYAWLITSYIYLSQRIIKLFVVTQHGSWCMVKKVTSCILQLHIHVIHIYILLILNLESWGIEWVRLWPSSTVCLCAKKSERHQPEPEWTMLNLCKTWGDSAVPVVAVLIYDSLVMKPQFVHYFCCWSVKLEYTLQYIASYSKPREMCWIGSRLISNCKSEHLQQINYNSWQYKSIQRVKKLPHKQ